MIDALPQARHLIGDRGYDADWFRRVLAELGTTACIPSKRNRKIAIPHVLHSAASVRRSRSSSVGLRTGGGIESSPASPASLERAVSPFPQPVVIRRHYELPDLGADEAPSLKRFFT